MWTPLQRVQLCLIVAACYGSGFSAALGISPRTVSFINSTRSFTRSSSSSSHSTSLTQVALVSPTATLLSGSSTENYTSTITSAPVYPWGNQIIPINTCSVSGTDASPYNIQYTPCNIFAGTVQMSYFPESKGNLSYPATYYNPEMGVTMTSPSVYMMVNTLTGDNSCGPLGPTYTNEVISMDLTDVYTLQPYADHTVTTRMGPPLPLTLSDLTSNCLNTYGTFSTDGAYINTHPVYGNYNRCHPRFVFPIELKRVGYPYWMHCGNDDYIFGIFDPPGAVPPVVGLLPTTVAVPVISTNDPASPLPTAASDQAASTTPAAAPASSGTSQHSLVPLVIPSAPLLADHAAPASTPTNPTDPLTSGTHTFTLISFTEGDLETVTYSSWFTKEPGATFPIVVQPAESTLSAPQISANMVFIHPADTSTSTSTDPAATPPLAVPSLSGVNPLLLSSPLSMLSRKISTITYEGVGTLPINIQTAESTLAVPQISADAAFIFPADISTLANPVSTLTPADPVNSGTNSFSVITIGFQIEATGLAFPTVLPLGMISTLADLSSLSDPVNPGTIPTASGNTIGYQTAATQLTLPDVPFASALADPSPLSDTVSIPYPADPSAPGMTPLSKNLLIPTSLPIGKPIYAQSAESSLAAAIATYLSNLADASITVDPASTPSPAAPSNPADPALPGKTPSPPTSRNLSNSPEPSNYPGFVQPAANLLVPEPSSSENPTTDTTPPVSNPPITTPSILLPTSAIAIAIIGTQTLSAIPGSSGVVLPNGSTATPGSVATVTDANSQPIVVSVGSSGIYIGGTSSGDSTSYVANPTIPPVAIATIGDEVLSAAPGASNVVIGSQTASLGDDAITVGGSIIQLTPSGVVVNDGSGGPAQTYAIPTPAAALSPIATVAGQVISAAPGATNIVVGSQTASLGGSPITVAGSVIQLTPSGVVVNDGSGGASTYTIPTVAAAPTPIATIGGQVISAAPGASTILVGGQTLTAGGVPVTLSGSNNVASLGPSGLVVQYPGGSVSSFARPTAAPSAEALIGTIAGLSFSVPASASVISIGSQGVTLGGSPVTVSNDVVSLGPSGLAIQLPGGGVSTIAPEAVTSTSSGKGIASIIASIAGASQTGTTTRTGSASGSSSTALSSSPVVTKSAASRVAIGLMGDLASWAVVCLMLGFVLV